MLNKICLKNINVEVTNDNNETNLYISGEGDLFENGEDGLIELYKVNLNEVELELNIIDGIRKGYLKLPVKADESGTLCSIVYLNKK